MGACMSNIEMTVPDQRGVNKQLMALVAHDLRGPLTAAHMCAQRLTRRLDNGSEDQQLASRIIDSIDRADRMLRDLLDFNRIQLAEPLYLRLEEASMAEIGQSVVTEFYNEGLERVSLRVEEPVRGIWAREEVRRALWHLVANGLKYGAENGAVEIIVHKSNVGAHLSVHNHCEPGGIALTPEQQALLFTPMLRTLPLPAGVKRGWCLGLALTHAYVTALGGSIHVTSSSEHGTTFTIDLPIDARAFQAAF